MYKDKLIIIGAGGHANACIDVIEQTNLFEIVGLVGALEELHSIRFGYKVLGTNSDLLEFSKIYKKAVIGVGQIHTSQPRFFLYQELVDLNFQLPIVVATIAHVSRHAVLGAGTIVMNGAVVNAGAKVGENCIINTGAILEHDVTVGSHTHISTGAIVNGDVKIGDCCFIGSGCIIRNGVSIGNNCLVRMGSVIKSDIESGITFSFKHSYE